MRIGKKFIESFACCDDSQRHPFSCSCGGRYRPHKQMVPMRFQHYSPRVANITDKDTANCRRWWCSTGRRLFYSLNESTEREMVANPQIYISQQKKEGRTAVLGENCLLAGGTLLVVNWPRNAVTRIRHLYQAALDLNQEVGEYCAK